MSGLFTQLKRRNVFRVAAAYVIVGWIVLQVGDLLLGIFEAPGWVAKTLAVIVAMGFPIACVFAWAFELTPEGVKRTVEVDQAASITAQTGRRLDVFILVALVALIAITLWLKTEQPAPTVTVSATVDEPAPAEPTIDPASIAVLPFVNMSEDPAQEYFSDGISEELLNVLAGIDALRVASRTSAFAYKDSPLRLPEIAAELGVAFILEGSVRKAANQVRITAQLIDTRDDRHLWSETFDRSLEDIFAIQSEIANAIGAALLKPLGLDIAPLEVAAATENLDAYDLYLKGRTLFTERDSAQDMAGALHALEQAVALDPSFLQALQLLAATYGLATYWGITERSREEFDQLAASTIDKACLLDPDNALSYAVRGFVTNYDRYAVKALSDLNRALSLDPDLVDAVHWRGITFIEAGLMRRGIEDQRRCLELDPSYWNCANYIAGALINLGEIEAAASIAFRLRTEGYADIPSEDVAYAVHIHPLYALERGRHAVGLEGAPIHDWIEVMQNPSADRSPGWRKWLAWSERTGQSIPIPVAASYEAWDRVNLVEQNGDWIWLPQYSALRQSQAFREIARVYDWPSVWREYGWPPQCRPVGDDDFACN